MKFLPLVLMLTAAGVLCAPSLARNSHVSGSGWGARGWDASGSSAGRKSHVSAAVIHILDSSGWGTGNGFGGGQGWAVTGKHLTVKKSAQATFQTDSGWGSQGGWSGTTDSQHSTFAGNKHEFHTGWEDEHAHLTSGASRVSGVTRGAGGVAARGLGVTSLTRVAGANLMMTKRDKVEPKPKRRNWEEHSPESAKELAELYGRRPQWSSTWKSR